MSKPLVLCVVDDDEIYKFAFAANLRGVNFNGKVMSFSDGDEAINFMLDNLNNEEGLPDVIFLDINMPVMDGFQFMEEFVKIKPKVGKKITIYMVTSSVDPADIEAAQKISDISDYIVKPISGEQVIEILKQIKEVDQ